MHTWSNQATRRMAEEIATTAGHDHYLFMARKAVHHQQNPVTAIAHLIEQDHETHDNRAGVDWRNIALAYLPECYSVPLETVN